MTLGKNENNHGLDFVWGLKTFGRVCSGVDPWSGLGGGQVLRIAPDIFIDGVIAPCSPKMDASANIIMGMKICTKREVPYGVGPPLGFQMLPAHFDDSLKESARFLSAKGVSYILSDQSFFT